MAFIAYLFGGMILSSGLLFAIGNENWIVPAIIALGMVKIMLIVTLFKLVRAAFNKSLPVTSSVVALGINAINGGASAIKKTPSVLENAARAIVRKTKSILNER